MKTNNKSESQNKASAYLKYSGLAFQLAFVVVAGLFLGKWIDGYFGLELPLFTMGLLIIFFALFMYKLYKDLTQKP